MLSENELVSVKKIDFSTYELISFSVNTEIVSKRIYHSFENESGSISYRIR